jgi:hypothetical protein
VIGNRVGLAPAHDPRPVRRLWRTVALGGLVVASVGACLPASGDVVPSLPSRPPGVAPDAPVAASDDGRRIVLAAPWPLSKADTAFYRMVILPDGFPARNEHGRAVVHPLYGVYLVQAYRAAYRKTGDVRSRRAMEVVARAAVRRMRSFRGGLVFWYDAKTSVPLKQAGRRAYSALTQAYYAEALADVAAELNDRKLRLAAAAVFASLQIPTSKGGVNRPGRLGPVLEEEPTAVPSAILNGWLSTLASLRHYAIRSTSAPARQLLTTSAHELARRLPRYDLRPILGTAYSAFAYMTLRLDLPVGTTVSRASELIDGGAVPLRLGVRGPVSDAVHVLGCGRSRRGVVTVTCRGLRLDVPVSSAGADGSVRVRFSLRAPGRRLAGTVWRGRYRYVHDRGRSVAGWTRTRRLSGAAGQRLDLLVPLDRIVAAEIPPPFKWYGGHRVNTYHLLHIKRLAQLADVGGPAFVRYARVWNDDMCRWAGHPAYVLIPRRDLVCPPVPPFAGATSSSP